MLYTRRRTKNAFKRYMANSVQWTASAEALLKEIPFFVRPAARKKIEKYARENGLSEITDDVYAKAKAQFGRKK